MTSRMETAMERGWTRLSGRIGKTVTLKRGATTTTGVTAVLGSQLLRVESSDGSPQTIRTDKDFLIHRDDYQFNAVAVEPLRGDRIVETINDVDSTYELLPYGNEPVYRWSHEFRNLYRIHTKRVK